MTDRDLAAELDDLKADIALLQRVITDAKETSDEAFRQAAAAAAHVAALIQRVKDLRVEARIVG